MPILEIVTNRPHVDQQIIANLSKASGAKVIEALGIPDENDWEFRFTVDPSATTTIKVAYSCGSIDYPEQAPGKIFDPNEKQMLTAGQAVQQIFAPSLGNLPVRVEAYYHTSFLVVNPEHRETPLPPTDSLSTQPPISSKPILEIAFSPSSLGTNSPSVSETIPPSENPHHQTLIDIQTMIQDTLGLETSDNSVTVQTIFPQGADTDLSVNILLPEIDPSSLPQEVLDYLARMTEYLLNNSPFVNQDLSATVWVIPGRPKTVTVPATE